MLSPTPASVALFNDFKLGRTPYKWLFFAITDSDHIDCVERGEGSELTFEDFVKSLPEDQPRWAVTHINFLTTGAHDASFM